MSDLKPKSRTYHQHPKSAYPLPADQQEGQRLNAQHKLFENNFYEGRLLPDYITLGSDSKVLDAGTGTGIWITDLASKATVPPTVKYVGIDISPRLFPSSPPSNITFLEHSTTTPIPAEWENSFDLVHQRAMISAFRSSEWITALSNFYRALKPGGQLILMEGRPYGHPQPGAIEQIWRTVSEVMLLRGIHYGQYIDEIPKWLQEVGFVDVRTAKTHQVTLAGSSDEAVAQRTNLQDVLKAMSGKVADTTGLKWMGTSEEFEVVVDEAIDEYERSPELGLLLVWFSARRPL